MSADAEKVRMMTDVACFCGSFYSFDGGAGACPQCGEYATVMMGAPLISTERSQQKQSVRATNGDRKTAETSREAAEASADCVDGSAIDAIAGDPGIGQVRLR
jgi:predicted ATP-dependent serine protease